MTRPAPDAAPLTVSVNLSARQFQQPFLIEAISNVLERSGPKAGVLTLEITETVMMESGEGPHR